VPDNPGSYLRLGVGPELVENVLHVSLNRALGDREICRNLLISLPFRDEGRDLLLPWCEEAALFSITALTRGLRADLRDPIGVNA
jgi:hypothetical protein